VPSPTPPDLRKRTFQFTCDLFDFCQDLTCFSGVARYVAFQLFRAGASVGANLEEAKAAYSRKEFASKTAISLKESREANYWLRVAEAKSMGSQSRRAHVLRESNELVAILTSCLKRLQMSS